MISFKDFLVESVKFNKDIDSPNFDSFSSTHEHGGHRIQAFYTRTGRIKNPHHWNVDFAVDDVFRGNSDHVPAKHKAHLLRHLGHSFRQFMKQMAPHRNGGSVQFRSSSTDERNSIKSRQYRTFASSVANTYGGRVEHLPTGATVHFGGSK